MFNLDAGAFPSEGFLVSFIIIAVVLDAALDLAVMLGLREEEDAMASDGRGTRGDR
jgi:NADH-quinone oxidoreductase subunit J